MECHIVGNRIVRLTSATVIMRLLMESQRHRDLWHRRCELRTRSVGFLVEYPDQE
jgi:hypothetical protein